MIFEDVKLGRRRLYEEKAHGLRAYTSHTIEKGLG